MNEEAARGAERLIRADLRGIEPYSPIVPFEVLSERCGIPQEQLIKLDGNENPYGCSPRVRDALGGYSFYHIYPDPLHRLIEEPLQAYVGVGSEHIVAGAGSDELIDLVLRLFIEPGDRVVNCPPTFGMYPFSTGVCGGRIVDVPRTDGYDLDVAAVRTAVDGRTKVIFVASPNNPTGSTTPRSAVLKLLETGAVVVVDEAYCEFSGQTFVDLVPRNPNLVILRSFSKWAGLGGLRVGYGVFPAEIAEFIRRIKIPYNVNIAAMIAVKESLADIDFLQDRVRAIVAERDRLSSELRKQGVLSPLPSQANFVLCDVVKGNALEIKLGLERKGIFIRHFDTAQLRNMLRISVGRPEHTDALIEALTEWEGATGNG